MKKLVFAAVLACMGLAFSSCGDVQKCYEITATYKGLLGEATTKPFYVTCTKNELKDEEARIKDILVAGGISEDVITLNSKAVPDSNCE